MSAGSEKALSSDMAIDLETLRFIRDGSIPHRVPSQRLAGLARRGLAQRDGDGWILTLSGWRELARLADLEREQ